MAKMTLLAMTQNILSAMDGDAVNSIADTVESLQVAETIVETYHELYAGKVTPSMWGLIQLDSLADPSQPTTMSIPSNVKSIKWIKYNKKDVDLKEPEQFIIDRLQFDNDLYGTDKDPSFWTTFDNQHIVFNSINLAEDGVLQASKTVCWGQFDPVFELTDDAYAPYLTGDDYPGLLAEAKSTCFINYKNSANSKEEQKSKRQRVRRQNDEWRANQRKPYEKSVNYGRPTRGGLRWSGRATTSTP